MCKVQRLILLALLVICNITSNAIDVTFPTSFEGGWESLIGKTVTFTNDMYVCEHKGTTSLGIAYRRLRTPEENAKGLADGDSLDYYAIQEANKQDLIRLWGVSSNSVYSTRKGARVHRLTAKVTGINELQLKGDLNLLDNAFPTKLPSMGYYQLLVCATNIEHFWTTIGQLGADNAEQLERQKKKIATALVHINADIYAICELQEGRSAISALTDAMNSLAGETQYAYVDNGFNNYNADMVGFIYRKDKVSPYGTMQFPYAYGVYHYRMIVKGFKDKNTNESFVISLNHTKSKAGEDDTDDVRMENVQKINECLTNITKKQTFKDSDILIVGDYNAYSQEACIRYLVEEGDWEDQVLRFDSLGYSYAYGSEVGYLDRVFTSSSLSPHITAVHPYHINTDYYYRHGYAYNEDVTMCRYADHDPILIGINFSSETAFENIDATSSPAKICQDGRILIIYKEHIYNILGQPIQ